MSQLKDSLLFLVRITSDTNEIAVFIQPHLHKINNPHLHHFHNCLQHKKTAFYAFSAVINQISLDCSTDDALKELMEHVMRTFS